MLLAILVIGFASVSGALVMVYWRLGDILQYERANRNDVLDIRRQVHTRQRKAAMNSGVPSEEAQMTRLGQVSRGRRVVVGGEEESGLHQALSRQGRIPTRVDDDMEDNDG